MRNLFWIALLAAPLAAEARRPLVAVGGVVHETNTFNPRKTGLADFETGIEGAHGILRGPALIRESAAANNTTSGFIEGARRYGFDLHPTLMAGPQTLGLVTGQAFDTLTGELIERLKAAPKLDGILLWLHGTMVAEGHPHADAEVVRRVRAAVGKEIPIVVTHDFHANVSEEIVRLTTALITYKECPHLDAQERGIQAARILADTVRGKVKPVQALARPPMIYNIVYHNTFAPPLKPIVEESRRLVYFPAVPVV